MDLFDGLSLIIMLWAGAGAGTRVCASLNILLKEIYKPSKRPSAGQEICPAFLYL